MRITEIRAVRLELTDSLRAYVQDKVMSLEKFTKRYSVATVDAELGKTTEHHQKGPIWRAVFKLDIPGTTLRAEAITEDLYSAIDQAKDDLKRLIVKHSEKVSA